MELFDPNNERERLEQKFFEYFGHFTEEARKKLLSKNLPVPQDLYEVYYPRVRRELLAKNISFSTDLSESSKTIRDLLISKNIQQEINLEKSSEDIRKSLLARQKIEENSDKLLLMSEDIRKNLLAKKKIREADLLSMTSEIRRQSLAKNKENVGKPLDESTQTYRENALSKNKNIDNSLLEDSKVFHDNQTSKNEELKNDLLESSELFLKQSLLKNDPSQIDIEKQGESFRSNLLSKNNVKFVDLETFFNSIRKSLLSLNKETTIDLIDLSEAIRSTLLSRNIIKEKDVFIDSEELRKRLLASNKSLSINLEEHGEKFRRDLLSLNKSKNIDLSILFEDIRNGLKGKNKVIVQDLAALFEGVRTDLLSKNKSNNTELQTFFDQVRQDLLSRNKPVFSDLLSYSEQFRNKKAVPPGKTLEEVSTGLRNALLSQNKLKDFNLFDQSVDYRSSLLSANNIKVTDLFDISSDFRSDLLSLNKAKVTDLLTESEIFRNGLLSLNIPEISDLLTDSIAFRERVLSFNIPKFSDLFTSSEVYRKGLLALNIKKLTDLLSDSIAFREHVLSFNVPKVTNLVVDSIPFRNFLIAKNVPKVTDLAVDSISFRNLLLALNIPVITDLLSLSQPVRDSLLSSNIPNDSDLVIDSVPFRDLLISMNIPKITDLLNDSKNTRNLLISKNGYFEGDLDDKSEPFRESLLSMNKPNFSNLLNDSIAFRKQALSKNTGFGLLGFNVNAAGTSTFIGVSRVYVQGILYRALLKSKNKPNPNLRPLAEDPTTRTIRSSMLQSSIIYNDNTAKNLQTHFGLQPQQDLTTRGSVGLLDIEIRSLNGIITSAIRKHNLERNSFNTKGYTPGGVDGISQLQNTNFGGFQELIQKTIGSFAVGNLSFGNTTPESIITKNNGNYIAGDPKSLYRPEGGADDNVQIGTAVSMMSQTVPGNPLEDEDFRTGKRGVKHIIRTIRNNSDVSLAKNYKPQTSHEFLIGKNNDGSPKISRQRFTLANPYAPGDAGKLIFYFRNYSMDEGSDTMYFPPYIKSYSDSESANWNSVAMLGRPEPIYTYNNSTREGSISFYVLTDYAQRVDIGYSYDQQDVEKVSTTFNRHFTDSQVDNIDRKIDDVNTEIDNIEVEIRELNAQKDLSENTETATIDAKISDLQRQKSTLASKRDILETQRQNPIFAESNRGGKNIYGFINNRSTVNGEIVYTPEDTLTRINDMKSKLTFQPSFFSGDKVDFLNRMEFLAKMTRPSRNEGSTGFSFIKPPVCHIHLGHWWNNDVIITNVSKSYDDAPWAFDGNRVQPMWVLVTVSFNIVGPYRHGRGGPVTSTDKGGFYTDRSHI